MRARWILLSLAFLAGSSAAQVPDTFTNLRVLAKNIEKRALVQTMKDFTRALGARCSDCHMGEESADLSTYDFASDGKALKRSARTMMRWQAEMNRTLRKQLKPSDGRAPSEVTCATCHRGRLTPENQMPPRGTSPGARTSPGEPPKNQPVPNPPQNPPRT